MIHLWDVCAEDAAGCGGSSAGNGFPQNDGFCIGLKLAHCEMKLLLLLDEDEEYIVKKYLKSTESTFLGDWTKRFEQAGSDSAFASWDGRHRVNTATYRYVYTVPEGQARTGTECFSVRGEEMAECVCNGAFAGVSFYGPHTFRIGHLLKEGKNEVCLRFTGNAVNLYGDVKVPFGLEH